MIVVIQTPCYNKLIELVSEFWRFRNEIFQNLKNFNLFIEFSKFINFIIY